MTAQNVEFVRSAFDPWVQGRVEEFRSLISDHVEWDLTEHPLPDFPNTGSGRDEFLHHLYQYAGGWVDYRSELVELVDAGDDVIAVVHEWARMRGTGVDLDRLVAIVWTIRDGRFTRFRVFRTRELAQEALGAA